MVPYRAILGTPESFGYPFAGADKTVTAESTSHLSNLVVDLERGELRLTASGPVGTNGNLSIVVPYELLPGPTSVEVDGTSVAAETEGQTVSFSFAHHGATQVVIS